MNEAERTRLFELFAAVIHDQLSDRDQLELETLLKSSADARRLWFICQDVQMGLSNWTVEEAESRELADFAVVQQEIRAASVVSIQQAKSLGRRTRWGYAVVAAATLLISLCGQWWWTHSQAAISPPLSEALSPATIATLVRMHDVLWSDQTKHFEGQRLAAGSLRLAAGAAIVHFDSGAAAVLSGNVDFELESRGSALLRTGNVTIRAPQEAFGFTLRTPTREVVDLGTEFAVVVDSSGVTEVHVLDGAVTWNNHASAGEPNLLRGGEAVRFDSPEAAEAKSVALAAPRFDQLVERIGAAPAGQRLIAYEGFDYPQGPIAAADAAGGHGWASPWRIRHGVEVGDLNDTNRDLMIVGEPLASERPALAPKGASLELSPIATYRVRQLATPLDMSKEAVYYLSFLARAEAIPMVDEAQPHFRLTFRSATDYWNCLLGFGLPPSMQPQIYRAHGDAYNSPVRLPPGENWFWVCKIVASQTGTDEVFLQIYRPDDPVGDLEPTTWTVATGGFSMDGKLDLLVLTGIGNRKHWFDELRVGTTWESVTMPKLDAK